jgi:hypothetical protein
MPELLEDPLVSNGVGLMAVVNPDPGKPGTQIIDLRVSATDIRMEPRGDKWVAAFDVAISIEGGKGASIKTYSPQFTADQAAGVLTSGMDLRESLDVGGTSGVFRISLLDKLSGASGSLRLPFTAAK